MTSATTSVTSENVQSFKFLPYRSVPLAQVISKGQEPECASGSKVKLTDYQSLVRECAMILVVDDPSYVREKLFDLLNLQLNFYELDYKLDESNLLNTSNDELLKIILSVTDRLDCFGNSLYDICLNLLNETQDNTKYVPKIVGMFHAYDVDGSFMLNLIFNKETLINECIEAFECLFNHSVISQDDMDFNIERLKAASEALESKNK